VYGRNRTKLRSNQQNRNAHGRTTFKRRQKVKLIKASRMESKWNSKYTHDEETIRHLYISRKKQMA